jgi:peroxiredoxin family protein
MESNWKKKARSALLLGSLALLVGSFGLLPGCIAAGAAAAGAGSGIYFTSRGAESIVEGSVEDVERRARAVFAAESIPVAGTQTENSGKKREIKGNKGDLEVTVTMESQTPQTTKTEVSARKNLVTWDKDYAEQLLGKIVKQK